MRTEGYSWKALDTISSTFIWVLRISQFSFSSLPLVLFLIPSKKKCVISRQRIALAVRSSAFS